MVSRGILNLLLSKSRDGNNVRLDANAAFRILRTRMVTEIDGVSGPAAAETRSYLVRVILELLCMDDAKEITTWVTTSVCRWYFEGSEWKLTFEKSLQQLVRYSFVSANDRGPDLTCLLPNCRSLKVTGQ